MGLSISGAPIVPSGQRRLSKALGEGHRGELSGSIRGYFGHIHLSTADGYHDLPCGPAVAPMNPSDGITVGGDILRMGGRIRRRSYEFPPFLEAGAWVFRCSARVTRGTSSHSKRFHLDAHNRIVLFALSVSCVVRPEIIGRAAGANAERLNDRQRRRPVGHS